MVADRPQPWLIMHRAAESRRRLAAALQSGALRSGADFVEVDLRLGARVECRHDALVVPWLPLLTQRHLLPRVRLRRLWLEEIRPPARLFLDFKEDDPRLVEQSVDTMRRSGLLSSGGGIDAVLAAAGPAGRDRAGGGAVLLGGAQANAAVGGLSRAAGGGGGGAGVSLHRSLATPERLQQVAAAGLRALVYPVNDASLGERLVAEGAGGLISDRPALVRGWRERWGSREG